MAFYKAAFGAEDVVVDVVGRSGRELQKWMKELLQLMKGSKDLGFFVAATR